MWQPLGVAYDAVNKRLYVADNMHQRILTLDATTGDILGTLVPPELSWSTKDLIWREAESNQLIVHHFSDNTNFISFFTVDPQ